MSTLNPVSVPRPIIIPLLLLFASFPVISQSSQDEWDPRADWIPVGSVPDEVVRTALEARARFETGSIDLQNGAFRIIRNDMDEHGMTALRIAAVPVLLDLLGLEYRILEVPTDFHVDPRVRVGALELLADLGGDSAVVQLRQSILDDEDEAVRVTAAMLLASEPSDDPDTDFATISRAFYVAVRRGAESEVSRLLDAANTARLRAWSQDNPYFLSGLVDIVQGPYSGSLRKRAMDLLEELAER